MKRSSTALLRSLIFVIGGTLAAGPTLAEKPAWAGGGKGGKDQKHERDEGRDGRHGDKDRGGDGARRHGDSSHRFNDTHRATVHDYYGSQSKAGRCPPGLAKKNNGCMPPGQARKWALGKPLPRDVVFYDVPQPLVVKIGVPPSGYRYVRVAGDILMIAIGTAMVVDAIQDLGRR